MARRSRKLPPGTLRIFRCTECGRLATQDRTRRGRPRLTCSTACAEARHLRQKQEIAS